MISQRIRQARTIAGLSQDQVVAELGERGVKLTKAALSKYERGGSVPRATLLKHLGAILGVPAEYFLREPGVTVAWLAFRKHAMVGLREQQRFQAMAEERVEAYVHLRESLSVEAAPRFPTREPVSTPGEAERAAERLRQEWALADLPVESVTELIERNEGIVVELPGAEEAVDGLAGLANGCHAVVVVDPSVTDDRRRCTLAHELGHLVMDTSAAATPKDEERLAHRFASAFLVPATVARRELGERRSHLTLQELGLLKIKHGLSMQAWLYRARDMGIIDEPHFNSLFDQMSRQGWRRVEPVQYCTGREQPIRFRQMVLRALAEGTLEMEQARRWCPDIEWAPAGEEPSGSVAALRKLPAEQRDMLLARAARDIADAYQDGTDLRGFDAPEVDDGERP
jgi:Zn-dependent peptidase ImmA (M78 family)